MNRTMLYMLTIGAFLTGVAELAVVGILPIIAKDTGISLALAGQLVAAYSLGFAIGTPAVIALTARIGRRKLLMLALIAFCAGCLVSYASTGYGVMIAGRALLGAAGGVYLTVAMGAVAKLAPPEQLGRSLSTISLAFSAASVLGAPVGIALADWWSWQGMYLLLGGGSLLVLVGLARLLPEVEGDAPAGLGRQFAVLTNPVIATGLILSLLFTSGISVMNTYLVPFLQEELSLQAAYTGLTMFALGLAGAAATKLGGAAADKWGVAPVVIRGLVVMAASLALLPVAVPLPFSLASGIGLIAVWMIAMSMTIPAVQTYFVQQASQSVNLVLGLNSSVLHLGVAIGAGIGGLIADASASVRFHPWMSSAFAVLALGAALVSFRISGRRAQENGQGTVL